MVMLVRTKVLGEVRDALAQQCDLNLGRSGVASRALEFADDFGGTVNGKGHLKILACESAGHSRGALFTPARRK